ncbi:MAG: type VI secretion system transmembrane protein TssO [Candidatus Symbiothrix sp.]|jgi:hypothetical protein|nr:type VI secretion system transmembrane protein TssO [Candidatus Symbiothrix sp.]
MKKEKQKNIHNRKEKIAAFIRVTLLFLSATITACALLFYHSGTIKPNARKEFAISKMYRIQSFRNIQNEQWIIADSIYRKIEKYDPGIHASYEESDVKYYLSTFGKLFENNSYDNRYKIFHHLSTFYNTWFADRKELWAKTQNIARFRKNLEECEIGLQRKKDNLKK